MGFIKSVCDDCWKGQNGCCHYPELCMKKALNENPTFENIDFVKP